MAIQYSSWRDEFAKDSLPLLLSTVVHTCVFLLLATCITTEQVQTRSTIHASFEGPQDASFEVCDSSILNVPLGEPAESDSLTNPQADFFSLDLLALSESDIDAKLSSYVTLPQVSRGTRPIEPNLQDRQVGNRTRTVHQVHTSTSDSSSEIKSVRFGGKRAPGARLVNVGPAQTLEVIVPGLDPLGSSVLSQANNLSLTGGAMMVSTAKPHPSLANVPLRLEYDASQMDGSRLNVIAGTQRSVFSLYDWELQPLAKFVDAGHHGAVSIHMLGRQEKVSLDAAFEQTLLGLRFIQADLMPRGIIMSQEYLPQDDRGTILGPGEFERLSADHEVASSVRELEPLMSRTRNGASFSVLTDAKVPFLFEIVGKELVITGAPYFFFWEPASKGNQVVPKKTLNDDLRKAWPKIKQANPIVIESMERSFRTVAFFRFHKKNSPENWNGFLRQLNSITLAQVPTPSILTAE